MTKRKENGKPPHVRGIGGKSPIKHLNWIFYLCRKERGKEEIESKIKIDKKREKKTGEAERRRRHKNHFVGLLPLMKGGGV